MFRTTPQRLQVLAACLALLTLVLSLPIATQAQTSERCFVETGFCISGAIRAYWEENGGLPVFGYPIAPARSETIEGTWTGPTQWFERDRLEDHANERKGVLAGRLGAQYLERTGRPWKQGNDGPQPSRALCTKFEQTGYNVCGTFGYEWQNNGGLARFGYPITPTFQEVIEGKSYLVQYFERRRMEYHTEAPEGQDPVLLGLLGREVFGSQSANVCQIAVPPPVARVVATYRDTLGCPNPAARVQVGGAIQHFEHGWMLWVEGTSSAPPMIFAIYANETGKRWRWQAFADTYREEDPVGTGEVPPAGTVAPTRGFGKIWQDNADIRQSLGWATEEEQGQTATAVIYNDGAWLVYLEGVNRAFVMQTGGFATIEQP